MDDFTIKFRAALAPYIAAFPGEMPDMRSIGDADYYALPDLMARAVRRGTPIVDTDFVGGISEPDPERGRVL
jgi:hypothetical protein